MFLLFAREHTRHISKITPSGHVENSTKEGWTEILKGEREGNHWVAAGKIAWWLCRSVQDL
jgi:hypothetical protein